MLPLHHPYGWHMDGRGQFARARTMGARADRLERRVRDGDASCSRRRSRTRRSARSRRAGESRRIGEHRHLRQKPERASSGVKSQETFMASPSFVIVEALYPGLTQLDFTGPHTVFSRIPGVETIVASVPGGVIESGGGLMFVGTKRLAESSGATCFSSPAASPRPTSS